MGRNQDVTRIEVAGDLPGRNLSGHCHAVNQPTLFDKLRRRLEFVPIPDQQQVEVLNAVGVIDESACEDRCAMPGAKGSYESDDARVFSYRVAPSHCRASPDCEALRINTIGIQDDALGLYAARQERAVIDLRYDDNTRCRPQRCLLARRDLRP